MPIGLFIHLKYTILGAGQISYCFEAVKMALARLRPHLLAECFMVFVVLLLLLFGFRCEPLHSSQQQGKEAGSSFNGQLDDINNSTLGFGKIYAISLPSRTDRRDAMTLMAATSGLDIEYIRGRTGDEVSDRTLPPPAARNSLRPGDIGSWRAHLDAISAVVKNNLETALIIEDDVDWDINIHQQMIDFAATTRALTQPLYGWSLFSYADPAFENPTAYDGQPPDLDFDALPRTVPPKRSPYGDNWDVLWIGHCGAMAPNVSLSNNGLGELSKQLRRGRVVHRNDPTVPERDSISILEQEVDPRETVPEHSRITHYPLHQFCTFAYAVSQKGARRILYELGLRKFDLPFDLMLRDICIGHGRPRNAICLTVEPALVHTHKSGRHSTHSDIDTTEQNDHSLFEKPFTRNIRHSVRLNLANLLSEMKPVFDQYPDKHAAGDDARKDDT